MIPSRHWNPSLASIARQTGVALLALLIGVLSRKLLLGALEGRIVWVTFYPAVVLASVFGGWACGILTAVGSCLIAIYAWPFFVSKPFIGDGGDWLGLYAFLFNCLMISGVAQLMHRARAKAIAAKETAEAATRRANAANKAKSMFLANMSHEIRTPMNAVLGFSQQLDRDPTLSESARVKVAIILKSGVHLLGIINDILEMSRIESGKLELRTASVDLPDLLDDLVMMFRQRATENGVELRLVRDDDLPRYIEADLGKIRQILINLIGNAIKFTHDGTVSVDAKRTASGEIAIEIADTGIGIAPDDLERIFHPFERARDGESIAGGTGLGLAISAEYARLMGGSIQVKSAPGSGSRFRFEFPAPDSTKPKSPKPTPRGTPRLAPGQGEIRVLLVDDMDANRVLLREMLEPIGFTIDEAANGSEALSKATAKPPRIVLMDLLMPVMDGIEATRALRADPPPESMAIVGVSASAFDDEKRRFLEAGLSAFLAKPIQEDELVEILSRHVDILFDQARPTRPSTAAMPREWRDAFRQAVSQGRIERIATLAAQAEPLDPALSEWIGKCAARYDMDDLKRLLEERDEDDAHG